MDLRWGVYLHWAFATVMCLSFFGGEWAYADSSRIRIKHDSQHWMLSLGSVYGQGDFDVDSTSRFTSFPVKLKYKTDDWQLSYSQSYVFVTGPAQVTISEIGGEFEKQASEEIASRDGVGDGIFNGSVKLRPFSNQKRKVRLGGKMKIPLADENNNLGSGETDWHLYGSISQRSGRDLYSLKLGKQWRGNSATSNYQDRTYFTIGWQHVRNRRWSYGGQLYQKDAANEFSNTVRSVYGFLGYRMNRATSVSIFTGLGLSDSAPDFIGGIQFNRKF